MIYLLGLCSKILFAIKVLVYYNFKNILSFESFFSNSLSIVFDYVLDFLKNDVSESFLITLF